MQAVVIESPGDVGVAEVKDPTPGPDEIVVAVRACGICGTDLHLADGDFTAARYPLVPGHEFAGEVVAVGGDVTSVATGALVAVDPSLYCGHCRQCRSGHGNLCENWNAIGVSVAGAAAEYVAVPEWNAHVLPAGFDMSLAALIEPLSCAVHGYDLVHTKLGDRFLIYGAGTMGVMLLLLASRSGAIAVTVVEPNAARRARASEFGATVVVSSGDELDPPMGYDVVMDATGVIAAIEDGIKRVRRGGTFLQFGVAAAQATASVSPYRIYNDEITLVGAMAVLESYDRACDLTTEIDLGLARLVSDRLPLQDYVGALERARRSEGYKIQLSPGGP
ncbi:MAG: alcohol dehydrogenase [Acidimicrobiaceae bacterium]|nr:alcohol dehydrogenase [Acidimicrobiaceae bacterium]